MNRKKLIFIGFIIIGIIFSFSGCKKKKEDLSLSSQNKVPPVGELHISFVSPRDNTNAPHESESIIVLFDRPMIPLEELSGNPISNLLKIEPPFPGKFRWLNPKTLNFTPDEPFPYSTEIKATVPAGSRSFDMYELKNSYSWSFNTIRPQLIKHFPRNKQKWIKLNTEILLVFNQPINLSKLDGSISMLKIDKENNGYPVEFNLGHPNKKDLEENRIQASPNDSILILPKNKLDPACTYYLELRSGLPASQGHLGMTKGSIFQFTTFNQFRFEELKISANPTPNEPLKFNFSNPVTYKEFVAKVRFEPEVNIPDYYSRWEQGESTIWLNLPLEPETQYIVNLPLDLLDEFGNQLGQKLDLEFKTSSYPPYVSMTSGHGVLEADKDLKYPIYGVNTERVKLEAAVLSKKDIIPLLTQEKLFWASEKFIESDFFQFARSIELKLPKNKREIFPLNIGEFLPNRTGVVFLQLDTLFEDSWNQYPKSLLQITNIGISAKFSPENNLIWITDLKNGSPMPGAEVELRDDLNRILWQGHTDENGKVSSPGWKSLGITSKDNWSKPRQWIFVHKNHDMSFISSEWGTGVYPYSFNIDYDWNPEPIKINGYIFSERGIYRAGETIHIKGIIRNNDKGKWIIPELEEVECIIQDPFYKQVFKQKINLDEYGSFSLDFESIPDAPLGDYQIITNISSKSKPRNPLSLYGSFRIEAFRPTEYELLLRSKKENFIFGDEYEAEIKASYLFGGSMSGQKINWNLRLSPSYYSPPNHKGYSFGNEIESWENYEQEESRLLSSGESKLDSQGIFQIKAKLKPENELDSVQVSLEATVQGPSRRTVSNRIHTIVHRGEFYIGLKPDTTFLKKGEEINIDLITVREDGTPISGKNIELRLIKREWHSIRKSEMGGRFRWISEKKDTEVTSQKIKSSQSPKRVNFKPDKSGFYIISAESRDNRNNPISTSTYFYLTGRDYVPWQRSDEDIVELVPDAQDYRPGDVAKILIKSPYEKAKALITVEREFILESRVEEIIGSSHQIEIPLHSDYIPNVFVSVLLVQGRSSDVSADREGDIGKPSFKIGYLNLNVDPEEKRLILEINKDKNQFKPGEQVTLKFKIKDRSGESTKANLIVAVVDMGVLSLIGYQTPDPFSLFYQQKPLSVQTSETRKQVVGQRVWGEKGDEEAGGGGALAKAMVSLSEVEMRGNFKFTAYWNPDILTDVDGNATISFDLPDNLTTFRVMAVAQTLDSCFGRADTTFKVAKPLLLQNALPRFARINDEFQGGVVVHNYSSQKGRITVECIAEGIHLLDNKNSSHFSLNAGASKEVLFSFRADKTGSARFNFRAIMGADTDGLEIAIPVKKPRPTETVALFNSTETSIEERIKIPENAFLEDSKLRFQAAASALKGLGGSINYLTEYPYLCLEQRVSSILPYIVGKDIILDFNLSELDQERIQDFVADTIRNIYRYQKDNGGFGLWPDSRYDSPFNSCYAGFALIKAQQAGYEIDTITLSRLANYLNNLLRGRIRPQNYPYSNKSWSTIQAYTLYILALLNQPDTSYANKLYSEKENLSLFAKTLLLKALNLGKGALHTQTSLLQDLLNKIKLTSTSAHFEDDEGRSGRWIYSSNMRTTAFILQCLIETGANNDFIPQIAQWIVEKRKAGRWASTQENFYVFHALNDFYIKYEKIDPDFKLMVSMENKKILEEVFKENRNQSSQYDLPLASFTPGAILPLKINMEGTGTLYYETRLTYVPKDKLEARDEGFTIYKEITDMNGNVLSEITAGSLVVINLQMIVSQESLFVVVNDPLPAGLEAVNPSFQTESREAQIQMNQAFSNNNQRLWWRGFSHIEIHDDRVLLFANSLAPGLHTHRYLARALTNGIFQAPGSVIEKMYEPETFGRSTEMKIHIK